MLKISVLGAGSATAAIIVSYLGFLAFVFALRKYGEHIRAGQAIVHADAILYWSWSVIAVYLSAGKIASALGAEEAGVLIIVITIIVAIIGLLIVGWYIDLLGAVKERLDQNEDRTI